MQFSVAPPKDTPTATKIPLVLALALAYTISPHPLLTLTFLLLLLLLFLCSILLPLSGLGVWQLLFKLRKCKLQCGYSL